MKATVNFTWGGGATEEYSRDSFAMAYKADNNHNFKQISIASSSLQYKEYKSTTDIKIWTKSATKKGNQGVLGSYGWNFPFKVMVDKYYAFLSSSFSITGEVSRKVKYFNVCYLYSHKIRTIPPTFGITISKTGVTAGISLTTNSSYRGYPGEHGG